MKSRLVVAVVVVVVVFGLQTALAQGEAQVAKMSTLKLGTLPVFPACVTAAPTHGDPSKEAATFAIKTTSGCNIPWHWHTYDESLIIVSGKGKIEMKDHDMSEVLGAGDTVFLPGKHKHQFTCVSSCVFYVVTGGAFDIHYVDKDGNEIKPEEALKASAKPAAKKGSAKK